MALKDIFTMIKADRYTADGCAEINKALENEVEDVKYNIGDISQKTGLQKTANGWVKPKSGKQQAAKKEEFKPSRRVDPKKHPQVSNPDVLGMTANGAKKRFEALGGKFVENKDGVDIFKTRDGDLVTVHYGDNKKVERTETTPAEKKESKPAQTKAEQSASGSAPSTIKYEDAQKAINNGQVVQWKDSDGVWHDVDPKTSELVMARDIGSKLRVKTDENGNPVKAKPEPGLDETRSKLLELEKRRRKFEKYPDMDDRIKLEQAALLSKAGFESRAAFEDFVKSEMPSDAAPRVLTGDCKIRVRKSK